MRWPLFHIEFVICYCLCFFLFVLSFSRFALFSLLSLSCARCFCFSSFFAKQIFYFRHVHITLMCVCTFALALRIVAQIHAIRPYTSPNTAFYSREMCHGWMKMLEWKLDISDSQRTVMLTIQRIFSIRWLFLLLRFRRMCKLWLVCVPFQNINFHLLLNKYLFSCHSSTRCMKKSNGKWKILWHKYDRVKESTHTAI